MTYKIGENMKKKNLIIIVFTLILLVLLVWFLSIMFSDKVYYRTYSKEYGWTKWVKQGNISGVEGADILKIQVKIEKHSKKNGKVFYKTYYNDEFQENYVCCGESNSNGKYKIEGIKMMFSDDYYNKYDIYYRTYTKKHGWLKFAKNEQISGSKGEAIQMIQINYVKKGKKNNIKENTNKSTSIGFDK